MTRNALAKENNQNRMVTALIVKSEFEESKQFFHLADNESLDKIDRFAEVRLLFDAVNKHCVTYHKPEQLLSVYKSMLSYFQTIMLYSWKLIKFGYKLWVQAKPLGCCVQLRQSVKTLVIQ